MRRLKKLILLIIVVVLLVWVFGFLLTVGKTRLPMFKDGDIIFQTSSSNQSAAIMAATGSAFTHVGIVKQKGHDFVVVEAVGPVKETPLKQWVKQGLWNRFAVYRDMELTKAQTDRIFAATKRLYGKPYDIFFQFDNDAIYCSELVYLGYKAAGIPLGQKQMIGELNTDNLFVRHLIEKRGPSSPTCRSHHDSAEACYTRIMKQKLITPASIAQDPKLTLIYTNYEHGLTLDPQKAPTHGM